MEIYQEVGQVKLHSYRYDTRFISSFRFICISNQTWHIENSNSYNKVMLILDMYLKSSLIRIVLSLNIGFRLRTGSQFNKKTFLSGCYYAL